MKQYISDEEKRLLFSALRREKDVCREIDSMDSENNEKKLVPTVERLEYKFYYDRMIKQIRKDAVEEFVTLVLQENNEGTIEDLLQPEGNIANVLQRAMDKFS